MIGPRGFQPTAASTNRVDIDKVFVVRVHSIVALGYARLSSAEYAAKEETTITGELAAAIELVLEEAAESWMRFFRVYDDPPLNDPRPGKETERQGRSRRRIDIKIDSSESSPYARFYFESKRLGKGSPVSVYLGAEGLGLFRAGEYAADQIRAGMLGYVQRDDEAAWAESIERKLSDSSNPYAITKSGRWQISEQADGLKHTYTSGHSRSGKLPDINIYHSLLLFC